ncbi:MAG: hypothetical protein AB7D20_11350 [Sulfuricurvum sp.]|jgi:hypothetical protein|uniref:hypothetical protein n=1 Tax=Sulfuricurvum sp. TaxID=2025608 RepID=UPI003D0B2C3A
MAFYGCARFSSFCFDFAPTMTGIGGGEIMIANNEPKNGPTSQKQRTKTRESKTGTATKTEIYPLNALKNLIRGGEPEG